MKTFAPAALTALNSGSVAMTMLVYMDLPSGPLRLNTSTATIDWSGHAWVGAGSMGSIEQIKDAPSGRDGLRFNLSGVPQSLLAEVMGTTVRSRDAAVYLCILNPDTLAVLHVEQAWAGKLSQMPITRTQDTRVISVTGAHIGDHFDRPKPFRQTDPDQQKAYPGDTSRRFIVAQAAHQDVWPSAEWGRK